MQTKPSGQFSARSFIIEVLPTLLGATKSI
jgi:hypothetical protein